MGQDIADVRERRGALPVILAAAVVQGWLLYGLHHAINGPHWPATNNPGRRTTADRRSGRGLKSG